MSSPHTPVSRDTSLHSRIDPQLMSPGMSLGAIMAETDREFQSIHHRKPHVRKISTRRTASIRKPNSAVTTDVEFRKGTKNRKFHFFKGWVHTRKVRRQNSKAIFQNFDQLNAYLDYINLPDFCVFDVVDNQITLYKLKTLQMYAREPKLSSRRIHILPLQTDQKQTMRRLRSVKRNRSIQTLPLGRTKLYGVWEAYLRQVIYQRILARIQMISDDSSLYTIDTRFLDSQSSIMQSA